MSKKQADGFQILACDAIKIYLDDGYIQIMQVDSNGEEQRISFPASMSERLTELIEFAAVSDQPE
jgi:hypothetical protein